MMQQDLLDELRVEAIDGAEDRLRSLHETVKGFEQGVINPEDALAALRLDAHTLKSVASSFDMKALKVMCHRLEDYFFNVNELTQGISKDILFFLDRMSECLDAFVNARDIDV